MAISKTLVATALTGMVMGSLSIGCGGSNAASPDAKVPDPAGHAKACCKGMNECKGKGGCKGGGNCSAKNECKGKGGCNGSCPKT
jgi:hypothetical protein